MVKFFLTALSLLLIGCVMLTPSLPHSSATGRISGHVLDNRNRPVAGAEVQAIYTRGWTTFLPPVPNAFIVGVARTDPQGFFQLNAAKRVDELAARTTDFRETGNLTGVRNQGNVIHISPKHLP